MDLSHFEMRKAHHCSATLGTLSARRALRAHLPSCAPVGRGDVFPMNILFVTTEFADFAKAGGLADVSAALPRALRKQGADVRVLLPGLQKVIDQLGTL